MDTDDIFEREKIKIIPYDLYGTLKRYKFVRAHDGEYYYLDKYTDKVRKFSKQLKTLSDYKDYLILVY
ncbi:se95 [Alphabaculovirus alterspexiguae]|uniref:Se95 n=1 Tax=Spodoptera exigua multiple nucleopolyhedrovirus TaxID=10454 RepID=A0A3G2JU41_9ABAC|nr:se95 [Spodoptera exigua multiple nucleopolyhedrovirus]AYN45055.1 se95 [Spodoptera exigua multiple nucleopolyhedrovirus]